MTQTGFLARLKSGETLILPGVFNALTARIAKHAGFQSVFLSGTAISNNFLAEPELGFLDFEQFKSHVEQVLYRTDVSAIVDFNMGFETKLAVRQAKILSRLGVEGLVMEDQIHPKRWGSLDTKHLLGAREMMERIKAVKDACPELTILGRTDALGVLGIENMLERVQMYHEAGADITFADFISDKEHMTTIASLPWPQAINIVEGGKTPPVTSYELNKWGFSVAIFSNFATQMAMKILQIAYRTLYTQKDTQLLVDEMTDWEERKQLIGLDE